MLNVHAVVALCCRSLNPLKLCVRMHADITCALVCKFVVD
jgi:hypothetical protein